MFTTTFGSPVTRYVIVHDIKRIVDNLNARNRYEAIAQGKMPIEFKKVHPHAFRHTFCTGCLEKGLDPVFVQRIMGHSKYDTTLSYSHVLDELTAKEVEKAGFFLDKEFA